MPFLYKPRQEGEIVESKDAIEQKKAREQEIEAAKQAQKEEADKGVVYGFFKLLYQQENVRSN